MKSTADHIAILVDDLSEAEKWYTDNLSGSVVFRDNKYVRFKIANTCIALIDKKHYPYAHTGILVNDVKDLPVEKGELVEHRDGTLGVYVKDPFGNYLEYIWYSPEQRREFLDD